MSVPTPILRSFDEAKAKAFYVDFLGFEIVFEHRFGPGDPLYMGLVRDDCRIHLSEHYGDAAPGTSLRIEMTGLDEFQQSLLAQKTNHARPGPPIEQSWGSREVAISDPFGNRLVFFESTE